MNLPNRLTIVRIVLVPFVAALILYDMIPNIGILNKWLIAGLVFGAAAITDACDGHIARKHGIVTDFGKLMDPVADKLLVTATLIALTAVKLCSPWVVIIVLLREFLVTSIRMVAAGRGVVIAANNWGKAKTIIQIIAIVAVIVLEYAGYIITLFELPISADIIADVIAIGSGVCMWTAAAVTLISGAVYVYQNIELFKNAK